MMREELEVFREECGREEGSVAQCWNDVELRMTQSWTRWPRKARTSSHVRSLSESGVSIAHILGESSQPQPARGEC